MSKEIVNKITVPDLLYEGNLRKRGAYYLTNDFNYVSGTIPLAVSAYPNNPVRKQVGNVGLNNSIYTKAYTNSAFSYPYTSVVRLMKIYGSDSTHYRIQDPVVAAGRLLSKKHIYYRSDYEVALGLDVVGTTVYIKVFNVPITMPTIQPGKFLAVKTAPLNPGLYDRYEYFRIDTTQVSSGGVFCTVTPVDFYDNPVSFSWSSYLNPGETPPINGNYVALKACPFDFIKILPKDGINIVTAPVGYESMTGNYNLIKKGNDYYIYYPDGVPYTLPGTGLSGVDARLSFDAVNYELSLLVGNGGTVAKPYIHWLLEEEISSRRFVAGTTRQMTTSGKSFNSDSGGVNVIKEYVLPSPSDVARTPVSWVANIKDSTFATPPDGDLYLELRGSSFVFNELNLNSTRIDEAVSAEDFTYDTSVRKTNPIGSSLPAGTVIAHTGTACPSGFKEVMGLVGDLSEIKGGSSTGRFMPEDAFYLLDDMSSTSLNYPSFTDTTRIKYIESENITRIIFTLPKGAFLDESFVSNRVYDWNNKIKPADVELLPRPDPKTAHITINLGFVSIRVPVLGAPALPPRKSRTYNMPIGERVTSWCPGVQLLLSAYLPEPYSQEASKMLVATIAQIQVKQEYRAFETSSSGSYPSKYPSSLLKNMALITGSGLDALGVSKAKNPGYGVYNWLEKVLGRESLPAISVTPNSSIEINIDLWGNWEKAVRGIMSAGSSAGSYSSYEKSAYLVKTGYLRDTFNDSGLFGFGAKQHNHIIEELPKTQLLPLDTQWKDTFFTKSREGDMPIICSEHGHGYLKNGSFNRPKAHAVKLCLKM